MMLRLCLACLASVLFFKGAHAAPPIDLTEVEGDRPKAAREKPLHDEDLVFTDPSTPSGSLGNDKGKVLLDVMGRSRPDRQGKALFQLHKNSLVLILKKSTDKRWVAVKTIRDNRKGWVPVSAVKLPTPPAASAADKKK